MVLLRFRSPWPFGPPLLALVVGSSACSHKGVTNDAGQCAHPLGDLAKSQLEGTVAQAKSAAMKAAQESGPALVECPLDARVTPKVVIARCGGTSSVMWSTGKQGATSYFDVGGKLVAYAEASDPTTEGATCGDGQKTHITLYGAALTCQPWTEQRYCAPSGAAAPSPSSAP